MVHRFFPFSTAHLSFLFFSSCPSHHCSPSSLPPVPTFFIFSTLSFSFPLPLCVSYILLCSFSYHLVLLSSADFPSPAPSTHSVSSSSLPRFPANFVLLYVLRIIIKSGQVRLGPRGKSIVTCIKFIILFLLNSLPSSVKFPFLITFFPLRVLYYIFFVP